MVVVNEDQIQSLRLAGDSLEYGPPDGSLSTKQLGIILNRLAFPNLKGLILATPLADPATLSNFLIRYSKIEYIKDAREDPSKPDLIYPPVTLPNLTKIEASTSKSLLSLLVGTAASPTRTLSFPIRSVETISWNSLGRSQTDRREANSWNCLLRHLSQRKTRTELELFLPPSTTFAEDDFKLAKSLLCVDSVCAICPDTETAAALLPWLGVLPALSAVLGVSQTC
ncbi:hypothetical protein B0H12DRAFT_1076333 [Mycena haematopus]|nr:hypothetical protein B0H12DRAFT_1076333 [Mycena haematopus]